MNIVNPLTITPEQVRLEDIIQRLCGIHRYCGRSPITVLGHSYWCSENVNGGPRVKLIAFMHDFAEAYTNDIPSPIKDAFPQLRELEERIMSVIYRHFNIPQSWVRKAAVAVAEVDKESARIEESVGIGHTIGYRVSAVHHWSNYFNTLLEAARNEGRSK